MATVVLNYFHDRGIRQGNLLLAKRCWRFQSVRCTYRWVCRSLVSYWCLSRCGSFGGNLEGVFFLEFRDQVLLGNIELLNRQVRWNMDHLDSINQWTKHVCYRVARANENTLAHVELEVQVAVSELV